MERDLKSTKTAAVIGGGPAGLMAAQTLVQAGLSVDLYDAMPTVGRKFLMAGKGGLNITHSDPHEKFMTCYGTHRSALEKTLASFNAEALRAWVHDLGIETFVGTSGRVFPAEMKAAPLLRTWLRRLREAGVRFHMRHRWGGWNSDGNLTFEAPHGNVSVKPDAVVLALGGGSWSRLGSDGAWTQLLTMRGVTVSPLQPSNCGFNVEWSEFFRERFAGQPVKSVRATFHDFQRKGEFVVTGTGIEGGLIYALSAPARDEIAAKGAAVIHIDLAPARDLASLLQDLSHPRGKNSFPNYLRKFAGIEGVKAALLREVLTPEDFEDPAKLANTIKALPLRLVAPRPLDEAISTAGGVRFADLDAHLMLQTLPGVFCAGEMLDWEAPTGGYLLTACFATGRAAGLGAKAWLDVTAA